MSKKGVNINWLLTGKGSEGIPIITKCPAGPPAAWYASEDISSVPRFEGLLRQGEFDFALYVQGDSMYPYMFDGDIIVVSPSTNYRDGDIVVARFEGDEVVSKRIKTTKGSIQFISDNPKYDPIKKLKSEVEILGKVTQVVREVRANRRGVYDPELVGMLRDPGIAELAGMVAELPGEFREALRVAVQKVPQPSEKGKDLALWAQRVFRRAGDEVDKLFIKE